LVSLSSCSEEEIAATATAPQGKDLFSNWTYQGNLSVQIDLTGCRFGTQAYALYLGGGGACRCMMNIAGSQSSGSIIMASCYYDSMGQGGADPGCAGVNGTADYTKTTDTLTICDVPSSGPCEVYK
jgi:hypothetical protein